MIEIKKNVIYVKGAKNGAIYNLSTGKVYSINEMACEIIDNYITGKEYNENYIERLIKEGLLDLNFQAREYYPCQENNNLLEVAWLEITQACNLRCIHCYEGTKHNCLSHSLTVNQWKRVIDELADLKVKRLIFIGGEPCCNKFLNILLDYAAQYSVHITLFTNATILSDRTIQCLVKNNISVKVSLYGHKKEVHDSVTGVEGSFEKMEANVKKMVHENIQVYASVIIMKENQKYVREIMEYAEKTGMKYGGYDIIREVYNGKQKEHIPDNISILQNVYTTQPNFYITKEIFDNACVRNSCWYGKFSIMENGDVIPCEFERNIKYGNVTKTSIRDIIRGEIAKKCWSITNNEIKICRDCEFRYACKDCRALALAKEHNLFAKKSRCTYDPINGKWESLNRSF